MADRAIDRGESVAWQRPRTLSSREPSKERGCSVGRPGTYGPKMKPPGCRGFHDLWVDWGLAATTSRRRLEIIGYAYM